MIQTIPSPKINAVSLQIAHLHQAEQGAETPGRATTASDCSGIDNPAIDEGRDAGEEFLSRIDQCLIKFIEIEFLPQYCEIENGSISRLR